MPEMDGIEATARIRGNERSQPWILAMTANVMEEDRQRCLDAGMDDFVSKPVSADHLAAALERASAALAESGRLAAGLERASTGPDGERDPGPLREEG